MESHGKAVVGFVLLAAMDAGFIVVNLAMFGTPGYAFAAGLLLLAHALAASALRHGWEDHAALLAWATAAAATVALVRWAVAELGQPLDATSPLAALLPVGHGVVAIAAWNLWRGVSDPSGARALRLLAIGAAVLALADLGFAAFALAAGGWPIGACLVLGGAGACLLAWASWQGARAAAGPPEPPTVSERRSRSARNP